MMLDPSVQIAITSVIGVVFTSVLGIVGTAVTAKLNRAAEDRKLEAVRREAADKIAQEKLNHIEHLSNSNLSATNNRLDAAMAQIKVLTDMISAQQIRAKNELLEIVSKSKEELVAEMRAPTTVPIAQAAEAVADALNTPAPEPV